MKTKILLIFSKINIICFVILFSLFYSQEKSTQKWEKGIVFGPNVSYFSREFVNLSFGFKIGYFMKSNLNKELTIHLEGNYSYKSANISATYSIFDENNNLVDIFGVRPIAQMGSIDIPIMLQYKIYKKFFIEAGPQISFLLHSDFRDKYKNVLFPKNLFTKTQLYGNVGAGYNINTKLSVDILYEIGLSNSSKTLNTKTNTFGLNLYYKL